MHARSNDVIVVLFDGVCNLCNAWVNFVIDHDPSETFVFGAQQSARGRAMLAEMGLPGPVLPGVVVVAADRILTDSAAILEICARLAPPWRFFALFRMIPRPLRDAVYRWVARHRYAWFGTSAACRIPTPELAHRFLT